MATSFRATKAPYVLRTPLQASAVIPCEPRPALDPGGNLERGLDVGSRLNDVVHALLDLEEQVRLADAGVRRLCRVGEARVLREPVAAVDAAVDHLLELGDVGLEVLPVARHRPRAGEHVDAVVARARVR